MNNLEIINIVKQDSVVSPYFLGVFPCDKIPSSTLVPCALVANTDSSDGPGKHWVAMYKNHDGFVMYFCSYGMPPIQKQLKKFVGNYWNSNDIQLQSPLSSACGQYAIFFLGMALRGCTMTEIQSFFDRNDLVGNDRRVTDFVNENYNVDTKAYDFEYIVKQICNSMVKNQ